MRKITFHESYRPVLKFGIISAILLLLLPALALDMGECAIAYLQALAIYLSLVLIVLFRRSSSPTKFDLFALKWGFVILFFLCIALSPYVWHLHSRP